MSTALNEAVEKAVEGKSPEFWPSDFLHIIAKAIYEAGKKKGSSEVLKSSNIIATVASGVSKRMSNEEYPLKKRFQSVMQAANEFDVFGYEELTEKIRQAYKEIVKRAYKASNEGEPHMDAKRKGKKKDRMFGLTRSVNKNLRTRKCARSKKRRNDAPAFLNKLKEKIANKYSEVKESQKKFREQSDVWMNISDCFDEIKSIADKAVFGGAIDEFDVAKTAQYLKQIEVQISLAKNNLRSAERF